MLSGNNIILASSSKIRISLLKNSGLNFKSISPNFDEEKAKAEISKNNKNIGCKELSMKLAIGKARSISNQYQNYYVIGCDQICEFENEVQNKPKTNEENIKRLNNYSGKEHYLNNATVILLNDKIIYKHFEKVKMVMRTLTLKEIENYVKIDDPIGCAGSYKYESYGMHLFEKVSGNYHTILGLAIQPLLTFLHKNKIIKIN